MADQGALNLCGTQAVTAYLDYIVHATDDPDIAILVFTGRVSGLVHVLEFTPILLYVTLGIFVYITQHAGPRLGDQQEAAGADGNRLVIFADDLGNDAGQGLAATAGLGRYDQETDD